MAPRSLVLKVTAGKDDPERCNQALTVAAAAAASGVPGIAVAHRRGILAGAAGRLP